MPGGRIRWTGGTRALCTPAASAVRRRGCASSSVEGVADMASSSESDPEIADTAGDDDVSVVNGQGGDGDEEEVLEEEEEEDPEEIEEDAVEGVEVEYEVVDDMEEMEEGEEEVQEGGEDEARGGVEQEEVEEVEEEKEGDEDGQEGNEEEAGDGFYEEVEVVEEEEEEVEEVEIEEEENEEEQRYGRNEMANVVEEEEKHGVGVEGVEKVDEQEEVDMEIEKDGNGEEQELGHEAGDGAAMEEFAEVHTKSRDKGQVEGKLLATKELTEVRDGDVRNAVQDKHIVSAEHNGTSEQLPDDKRIESLAESDTSSKSSKGSNNGFAKPLLDGRTIEPLVESNSAAKASKYADNHFVESHDSLIKYKIADTNTSEVGAAAVCRNSAALVEKEALALQDQTELQSQGKLSVKSPQIQNRRPRRSSSPDAVLEDMSKKRAIVCSFFAKGWCIKGKSCRFLHQKDGVASSNQQIREDTAASSGKEDLHYDTGSRQETVRLKEFSVAPTAKSPSNSQHQQQALSPPLDDFRQTSLVQNECKRPLGIPDGRQLASEEITSKNCLHEGKLHHEIPKTEHLNNKPFSWGSHFMNSSRGDYRHLSSGSSKMPNLYLYDHSPFSYERSSVDHGIQNLQSHFSLHDSKPSYSLNAALNSSFDGALQPADMSYSADKSQTEASSRSSPLIAEHFESTRMVDSDRGFNDSKSVSLPRNSSPAYLRSELNNNIQPNPAGDLSAFSGRRTFQFHADDWEPSVPFISSICPIPYSKSSSRSQYDPLVDSIDPPIVADASFQTSKTFNPSVSSQHTSGNAVLNEVWSPGYNGPKTLGSLPGHYEGKGISGKEASVNGTIGYVSLVSAPGASKIDGRNNSMPADEKHLIPRHVIDGANGSMVDFGNFPGNEADKGRENQKESKLMKIFHTALVEYLKELIKPAWREGHLSKDAHKSVIKKSVEKVLGALQPHQVPSTTEAINEYLSASRPKLLKLVEAYVEKFVKLRDSAI